MTFIRWIGKQTVVYPYNGLRLSNKKEQLRHSLVVWWLRIPGCHCCGSGSIPDPGTSTCSKYNQKKKGTFDTFNNLCVSQRCYAYERRSSEKVYILYDFIYRVFSKKQNYRDRKMGGCQGLGLWRRVRLPRGSTRRFWVWWSYSVSSLWWIQESTLVLSYIEPDNP